MELKEIQDCHPFRALVKFAIEKFLRPAPLSFEIALVFTVEQSLLKEVSIEINTGQSGSPPDVLGTLLESTVTILAGETSS